MASTKPRLIELPRIYDPRGSLSFAQDNDQIPFDIKGYFGYMTCLEELCAEVIATGKLMS